MQIINKQLKSEDGCFLKNVNDIGFLDTDNFYHAPSYFTSCYLAKTIDTLEKAQELFEEIKNIDKHNKDCEDLCRKLAEEEE